MNDFLSAFSLETFQVFDPATGTVPNTYNKMSRSMTKRYMRSTPVTGSLNSSRHDSESEERSASGGGGVGVNTSFEIGGTTTAGRGTGGPPVKLTNKALLAKIQADRRRKSQAELNSSMASSINHPHSERYL